MVRSCYGLLYDTQRSVAQWQLLWMAWSLKREQQLIVQWLPFSLTPSQLQYIRQQRLQRRLSWRQLRRWRLQRWFTRWRLQWRRRLTRRWCQHGRTQIISRLKQ